LKFLLIVLFTILSFNNFANASLITLGSLERDTSSNIVVDKKTNLEWLMWDYSETYTRDSLDTLLQSDGSLAGWSVANSADIFQLIENTDWSHRFTSNECLDNDYSSRCSLNAESINTSDGYMLQFRHLMYGDDSRYYKDYWTLFDATEQGQFSYETGSIRMVNGLTRIDANRGDREAFDTWTANPSSNGGRYALVRDAITVPEPSTLGIFLIAFALFLSSRMRA
jgi:hypothetical protein